MADVSALSDAALMDALNRAGGAPQNPLASMSDADLLKAIGQPEESSSFAGAAKSLGVGAAKGVIGLAGLPGDVTSLVTGGKHGSGFGSQAIQSAIEGYTGKFYEPKGTAEQYAQTIGEFAPALVGGPEGLATKALTRAVIPGAASEAAGQLTKGTDIEPYARIAGAVAGAGLPNALSRVISPATIEDPARAASVATLQNAGVKSLTAGDISGNKFLKYAENHLGDQLGAGNQASKNALMQNQEFTQAILNRSDINAQAATPDVMDAALTANSNQFNTALQGIPIIPLPKQTYINLQNVANDFENLTGARSPLLDGLNKRITNPAVSPTIGAAGENATISGDAYQAIRSDILKYQRAAQGTLKNSLGDFLAEFDRGTNVGLKQTGNAAAADQLYQARQQYKKLLIIERAVSGTPEMAAQGLITPPALTNAEKAVAGRRAYVRGQSPFSDLAHAGNQIMKPLPQSGTAARAATHLGPALAGAALFEGPHAALAAGLGAIAPGLVGRAIFSRPGQAYLRNQAAVGLRQTNLRRNAIRSGILGGLSANNQ